MTWPDPRPFLGRDGRPIRVLAVSDEVDLALESSATREALAPIDFVLGAGDLEPSYLAFLADGFGVPLLYVRGNHDVGANWAHEEQDIPEPLAAGRVHDEAGLGVLAFSGSPRYAPHGRPGAEQQVSAFGMWRQVLASVIGARLRRPVLVVSHAAPRGLNDATDHAHRGFAAFRWLVDRLHPPLWVHGHTALIRRGVDGRCVRHGGTLLVNVTGALLIELEPPGAG